MGDTILIILAIAAGVMRLWNTLLWTGGSVLLTIAVFGHARELWGVIPGAIIGLWCDLGSSRMPQTWRPYIDYSGAAVFLIAIVSVFIRL